MKNPFIEMTGFIHSVQQYDEELLFEIRDGKDPERITNLVLNDDSLLTSMSGEAIEVSNELNGSYITAFVNGRKPVFAFYPPRFYPELVAIRIGEEFGFVSVGDFNENLISGELDLKLMISEETEIINCLGESLDEQQIKNNLAFVYYTRSTRSIPAQASVSKVIVYVDPFGEMQDNLRE